MQNHFQVVLETREGVKTFECAESEYVLIAAAQYGISLPSTCRQGRCLSCAGQLISGSADLGDAECYFPQDQDAGFVLLCSAKPRSDLRIRTHRASEMRAYRRAAGLPAPLG
jgi:ferredoxin